MTRAQREAAILRNLPATSATLAHLLSSEAQAYQALASLKARGVIEESGGRWVRREVVRTFRRTQ